MIGTEVQLVSLFQPLSGLFTPVLSSLRGKHPLLYQLPDLINRPFTDMIYSAAHKKSSEPSLKKKSSASSLGKKSTPTSSTQTTPRKSSRNVKSEEEEPSTASTTATASATDGTSYAAVAAHEPSAEGAGNVTPPRKEPRINSIRRSARKSRGGASGTSGSEDEVPTATTSASADPARVTRSRSKGRTSGPGEE